MLWLNELKHTENWVLFFITIHFMINLENVKEQIRSKNGKFDKVFRIVVSKIGEFLIIKL